MLCADLGNAGQNVDILSGLGILGRHMLFNQLIDAFDLRSLFLDDAKDFS